MQLFAYGLEDALNIPKPLDAVPAQVAGKKRLAFRSVVAIVALGAWTSNSGLLFQWKYILCLQALFSHLGASMCLIQFPACIVAWETSSGRSQGSSWLQTSDFKNLTSEIWW